jgi:hypothetical protein
VKNVVERKSIRSTVGQLLNREFNLPQYSTSQDKSAPSCSKISVSFWGHKKIVRRHKRILQTEKTGYLRELAGPHKIAFAAQVALKESGQRDAANSVKSGLITPARTTEFLTTYEMSNLSPTDATSRNGIDQEIIKYSPVVLQIILYGQAIHSEAVNIYEGKTAKLFAVKYGWYYLSANAHKIIIQGNRTIN